jgi:hypothetical protein
MLRQKLIAVGIKATLTQTKDGPEYLFFPKKRAQRKRTLGISSKKLS